MPLLYLDFDGVLHHDEVYFHPRRGVYLNAPPEHRLFQHVGLLESALAPYPTLQIVLSTSWVRVFSFSGALKRLPSSTVLGGKGERLLNAINQLACTSCGFV